MPDYRRNSHIISDIKYHVVWVTKYRYKVLKGEVTIRARDLLRQVCLSRDIVIIKGSVGRDHVHMLISCPTRLSPAKIIQYLKEDHQGFCKKNFRILEKDIRDNTYGHVVIFVPQLVQLRKKW